MFCDRFDETKWVVAKALTLSPSLAVCDFERKTGAICIFPLHISANILFGSDGMSLEDHSGQLETLCPARTPHIF